MAYDTSTLLDRFCRYVRIDTQADEKSSTYPSSPGQLVLGRMLRDELLAMGLSDARQTEFGIVMATIPSNVAEPVPTIAFNAHVDTSPETSGKNVQPQIHCNYDGRDLVLPGDRSKVIRVSENPDLAKLAGKTIITTDGTTLLGSDDKSGVAVIMAGEQTETVDQRRPDRPFELVLRRDREAEALRLVEPPQRMAHGLGDARLGVGERSVKIEQNRKGAAHFTKT
jgi:tripeptide aminopeptidase